LKYVAEGEADVICRIRASGEQGEPDADITLKII
jgi:hypothetical protein